MKKRVTFKCWRCQHNYSLFLSLQGRPTLTVECPFCGEDGFVNLSPYRQDSVELFKGDVLEPNIKSWNLPDVLPTAKPQAE